MSSKSQNPLFKKSSSITTGSSSTPKSHSKESQDLKNHKSSQDKENPHQFMSFGIEMFSKLGPGSNKSC